MCQTEVLEIDENGYSGLRHRRSGIVHVDELGRYRTHYAWGYGGQFIFVAPDLELVAVTTSCSEVSNDRRTHTRTIYDLVERYVIERIAAASAPAGR